MIRVNPDAEYAAEMRQKLKENNMFCPCSLERNKDTKCRCKEFRDQIERGEEGYCHCGLYYYEKDGVSDEK